MRVTEKKGDVFDNLDALRLPDETVTKTRVEPRKVRERRKQFVQMSWAWGEKLKHVNRTWYIAMHLLHLDWKQKGGRIKLPNGWLEFEGISRFAKYRALAQLEELGLITVNRRPRKSPIVHVLRDTPEPPA
jgi:hypothetical protein